VTPAESPTDRIAKLGITLPEPAPAGVYRAAIRTGNQIYVAGQLPMRDGALVHPGRLGDTVTVEQGAEAARVCAINALGATNALLGTLEDLRIIRAVGLVAATPEFTQHPAVINGASEFLKEIFGDERGVGTRVAFGVASLPLGSSVEFELLLEIY
jgi:enamine deaminase RidA (YjgF/YER057c/UK114 family)